MPNKPHSQLFPFFVFVRHLFVTHPTASLRSFVPAVPGDPSGCTAVDARTWPIRSTHPLVATAGEEETKIEDNARENDGDTEDGSQDVSPSTG